MNKSSCIGCNRYTYSKTNICDDCTIAFNSIPIVKCSYCNLSAKLFEKACGYFKDTHYSSCNFMLPYTYPCHWTKSDLPKVFEMIKNDFICKKCFLEKNPKKYICAKCNIEFYLYSSEHLHCKGDKLENFKTKCYKNIEEKVCKKCALDIDFLDYKYQMDNMTREEKLKQRRMYQKYMDML